eukprot:CAMPEP_0118635620 /NCGR_PEP_ID=MMETSP0785-20121206/2171_1 /TAXON_ID=91992 /ORGANISM="Bolidomonas pacifica, Strain CCMP 1866" /LENGTH=757 /DNA_ID=CAMNT_0006526661 /DNA_START=87 /DNA_END=2357 /DNA_ORIENTATION=+
MNEVVDSETTPLKGYQGATLPNHVLVRAALHVEEALKSTPSSPSTVRFFKHPKLSHGDEVLNYVRLLTYRFTSNYFSFLASSSITAQLLLTFIQPPPWCGDDCSNFLDSSCYPSFPSWMLISWKTSQLIEKITLITILLELFLRTVYLTEPPKYFDASSLFRSDPSSPSRLPVSVKNSIYVVTTLFLFSFAFFPSATSTLPPIKPFLRLTLFVIASDNTIRELSLIRSLLPEVMRILMLEFLLLSIYAWFGTVIFTNQSEEGITSFSDFPSAMWSLWVLLTTANYPNIMMPAYSQNRAAFLYFSSFILVAYYFMMNLLLAAVYSDYDKFMKAKRERVDQNQKANLEEAFSLLDVNNEDEITKDTVSSLFDFLNEHCPDVGYIDTVRANLLFAVLDSSGDNLVDMGEFLHFCQVLSLEFSSAESYRGWFELNFHSRWEQVHDIVETRKFALLVDWVLVLNAVVIAFQSQHELTGDRESGQETSAEVWSWECYETIFTVLYVIEMILRVLSSGWKRYWEQNRNKFDFVVTMITVGVSVYVYYPNLENDHRWIRYVMMFRLLRLLRLVVALEQFQVIGATLTEVLPNAARMLLVLFCTFYLFSVIGVLLFGGIINSDPESVYSGRLKNTEFADSNFWANNFNDHCSAFVTLFELLVVNNWTVTCDGFSAATGSKVTRLFFVFFHLIGVVVINNLVISFVVEAFMTEYSAAGSRGKRRSKTTDRGVTVSSQLATFDATSITGTKSGVQGTYYARVGNRGVG